MCIQQNLLAIKAFIPISRVKVNWAFLIFLKRVYWIQSLSSEYCFSLVWIIWSIVGVIRKGSLFNDYQRILRVYSEFSCLILCIIRLFRVPNLIWVLSMWLKIGLRNDQLFSVLFIWVLFCGYGMRIKRSLFTHEIQYLDRFLIGSLLDVIPPSYFERYWVFQIIGFLFSFIARLIVFDSLFDRISKKRIFFRSYSLHLLYLFRLRISVYADKIIFII